MFPFLSRELLVSLRERRRFLMLGLLVSLAGIVTVTIWGTIQMQRMEISNYEISRAIFIPDFPDSFSYPYVVRFRLAP